MASLEVQLLEGSSSWLRRYSCFPWRLAYRTGDGAGKIRMVQTSNMPSERSAEKFAALFLFNLGFAENFAALSLFNLGRFGAASGASSFAKPECRGRRLDPRLYLQAEHGRAWEAPRPSSSGPPGGPWKHALTR